jgi:hypothetical protein
MLKSELIKVLKTFSQKEMMMLGKFLKSPYFNNRKRMLDLFLILKKFHPGFDDNKLTRKYIKEHLFRDKQVSESTVRSTVHKFLNLTYEFMKINALKNNKIEVDLNFTHELFRKKLFEEQEKHLNKILESLSSTQMKDFDYYRNLFVLLTDSFCSNLLTKKVLKKSFAGDECEKLKEGIIAFMKYFMLQSISHNSNLYSFASTHNLQKYKDIVERFLEVINFDKFVSYIKEFSDSETREIETYLHCLKAFTYFENDEYYKIFKKSLSENSKYFNREINVTLHLRLNNYLNRKLINAEKTSFDITEESFQLIDLILRKGYYKTEHNNYLPFDLYRGALMYSMFLKKKSYMGNLIETNLKRLLPEKSKEIKLYSYAILNFTKGYYDESMDNLNKIPNDEFVIKLDIKYLKTKILYETQKWEEAISILDSYKHFLKNNELLNEGRQIRYKNFIELVRKMIDHMTGSKKIDVDILLKDEKKLLRTHDKEWIIEKLLELKNQTNKSRFLCESEVRVKDTFT